MKRYQVHNSPTGTLITVCGAYNNSLGLVNYSSILVYIQNEPNEMLTDLDFHKNEATNYHGKELVFQIY